VTNEWAASFPRHSVESALALRRQNGLEAHDAGDFVWLRGSRDLIGLLPLLHRIPEITIYTIAATGVLTPLGRRIPAEMTLPGGPWQPLSVATVLAPQPAALPAVVPEGVALRLGRSEAEEQPGAIILPLATWADWAIHAPQVRLTPLRFAVCGDGRTLVLGRPLPPLRGDLLVDREGVLVACGYCWRPGVEAAVVRRLLNLAAGDVAILTVDDRVERIPAEAMVAASRSAARASLAAQKQSVEAGR
jgi:hypothetical protein